MDSVLILLSTYNGELFLKKQIGSLLAQKGVSIHILVRDDGSKDLTLNILKEYEQSYPSLITVFKGQNIGCAKSFMWLMEKAYSFSSFKYYAFCDQDDIWDSCKLKIATEALSLFSSDMPVLFFSHYQKIDASDNEISTNDRMFSLSLGEALIMNPSVGCTQVFNRKCLSEALKFYPPSLVLHDWWIYTVCLALSGKVIYDTRPLVMYRQHGSNALGAASVGKIQKLYNWIFSKKGNLCMNLAEMIYRGYGVEIPLENNAMVNMCRLYRKSIICRFKLLFNSRKFRTIDTDVNIGFILSVLFGKF